MRRLALAVLLVASIVPVAQAQTALSCGQTVTGAITFIGQQDLYTFSGQQGDIISSTITTTSRTDPGFFAVGTVYRPDGTFLQNVGTGNFGPLPQTGIYTISLHDGVGSDERGTYRLTLSWIYPLARQCNRQSIGCGPPTTGTIDAGEQDLFTFDAQIGDVISFVLTTTERVDPGFFVNGALYRPDGVFIRNLATTTVDPLPQSGTYTLSISDGVGRDDRGRYAATLTWIRGQCPNVVVRTPGPPRSLTASVVAGTVTLDWFAPVSGAPLTSYVLEVGGSPGSSNIVVLDTGNASTTFTAVAVPPGTYYVRVRARNDAGTSEPSNEVAVVVPGACGAPPTAPGGLNALIAGTSVTLDWGPSTGEVTTYVVEAGSAPGASDLASFETGNAATVLSVNAPPGTYYVRVRARNPCGTSAASNEVVVQVF